MISVQPRSGPTPGSLQPRGPLAADLDEERDLLVSRLRPLGRRVRLALGQESRGQESRGRGSSWGAPFRRGPVATGVRRGAVRKRPSGVSRLTEGAGRGLGEGRELRKGGEAASGGGSAAPAASATPVADAETPADVVAGVAHGAEPGTTTAPGVRSRERRAQGGPLPAAGVWTGVAPPGGPQEWAGAWGWIRERASAWIRRVRGGLRCSRALSGDESPIAACGLWPARSPTWAWPGSHAWGQESLQWNAG